jgi:hypothetical protein
MGWKALEDIGEGKGMGDLWVSRGGVGGGGCRRSVVVNGEIL